ncbi:MAG TPA: hypothetical protein VGE97_09310 [Nitrososphaera sp.]|jgi:hypothetical protein
MSPQDEIKVNVNVMNIDLMRKFIGRVEDFIRDYAWHTRDCTAIDLDGEWHKGNPPCTCGYDDAREKLFPK